MLLNTAFFGAFGFAEIQTEIWILRKNAKKGASQKSDTP